MATDAAGSEAAAAKINLALHVTGQRADGYHLLDSLVMFVDVADRISARPAKRLSLAVGGTQAHGVPPGDDNLVLRAARLLHPGKGAALVLDKHLPVASGIGGGSADAAAALRLLARLWQVALPDPAALLSLGADLPVCLGQVAMRMRGIGEALSPLPQLPQMWVVMVNPGVSVPTQAVYKALTERHNPPLPDRVPRFGFAADLAAWLALQRNDLQPAAERLEPAIAPVVAALAGQGGCLLARMSGSGATCFGLFDRADRADVAANALRRGQPHWWVAVTRPLDQADRSTT